MKTKAEIRYDNLVRICEEKGGTRVVAAKSGLNPGTLRQYIAKTETMSGTERGVGDKVARAIEDAYGLGTGWFDHEHRVDDPEAESAYSTLPQLDIEAAMGFGVLNNDYVETKGGLKFKKSFLEEEKIPDGAGEIIYAKGDSMSPTIPDSSVILINRAETEPRHGKVFLLIDRDEGARLKRLVRDREGWVITCDNPDKYAHRDEPFDEERHALIGRAVWFGSRL